MTPADTINRCLSVIREKWYLDKHERIFYRDKRMLTKAICRYGYACAERGWNFDSMFITKAIISVLVRIEQEDVEYVPVFIESVIDQHVRQRAEELNAQAKRDRYNQDLAKAKGRIQAAVLPDSVVVVEKSDTEVMAALYRQLNQRKPTKKAPVKQMALL